MSAIGTAPGDTVIEAPAEVLRWRLRNLLEAGCPLAPALVLAWAPEVDLHDAVELVERGCPGETAVRILL